MTSKSGSMNVGTKGSNIVGNGNVNGNINGEGNTGLTGVNMAGQDSVEANTGDGGGLDVFFG